MRFLAFALVLAVAPSAAAQNATQDVTVVVEAINEISVSGPVTLTIGTATAGQNPTAATDNGSTYAITTNGTAKKITAELDEVFDTDIDLSVSLSAPTVGVSQGDQDLGATPVDLVTGLTEIAESALTVTYTATPTGIVAPTVGETQTVTFTVTDG